MGGILDTWVTIFKSNTSSVEEGNKKATDSADKLIDRLRDTDAAAKDVGNSMKDTIVNAAKAYAGFLAAKATIGGVFEDANMIVELNQTAEALGETIENVDAFGKAAIAMGGDAQGARDSLTDLAEKMGEAASDVESGAAKAFKALKVGLKDAKGESKGAVQGMLDLAEAVEKLPKNEAVFKIKELGITDNRTVEMVLKGRKELERLLARQKEQGVVTKENAEQALKFKAAWGELSAGFERAGLGISTTLMPYFTRAMEALAVGFNWLEDHKDLVKGFFIAIGTAAAVFYVPPMLAAAAATLAATWPLIAITALVLAAAAAFALIYDDIVNFIDGNDSFIGQMAEKYPMVKTLVEGVAAAFKYLGEVGAIVWQTLKTGFQQMLDFILTGIKQIAAGVTTVAKFFGIGEDEEQAPTQRPALPSGSGQAPSDVPRIEQPRVREGVRDEDVPYVGEQPKPMRPDTPRATPQYSPMLGQPDKAAQYPAMLRQPDNAPRGSFPARNMQEGTKQLGVANRSPLNATTSNAISNTANNTRVENTLSIGELNVNAPEAKDADGIAKGATSALDAQLKTMQEGSANGRAR